MVFAEMFVHKYAARLQLLEVSIINTVSTQGIVSRLSTAMTEITACYPKSSVSQCGLMLFLGSGFVRLDHNQKAPVSFDSTGMCCCLLSLGPAADSCTALMRTPAN